jgi:hypothetical protein
MYYLLVLHDATDPSLPPIGRIATVASPLQGTDSADAIARLADSRLGRALVSLVEAMIPNDRATGQRRAQVDMPVLEDLRTGSDVASAIADAWERHLDDPYASPLATGTQVLTLASLLDPVVIADRARLPGADGQTIVDWNPVTAHESITTDPRAEEFLVSFLAREPLPDPGLGGHLANLSTWAGGRIVGRGRAQPGQRRSGRSGAAGSSPAGPEPGQDDHGCPGGSQVDRGDLGAVDDLRPGPRQSLHVPEQRDADGVIGDVTTFLDDDVQQSAHPRRVGFVEEQWTGQPVVLLAGHQVTQFLGGEQSRGAVHALDLQRHAIDRLRVDAGKRRVGRHGPRRGDTQQAHPHGAGEQRGPDRRDCQVPVRSGTTPARCRRTAGSARWSFVGARMSQASARRGGSSQTTGSQRPQQRRATHQLSNRVGARGDVVGTVDAQDVAGVVGDSTTSARPSGSAAAATATSRRARTGRTSIRTGARRDPIQSARRCHGTKLTYSTWRVKKPSRRNRKLALWNARPTPASQGRRRGLNRIRRNASSNTMVNTPAISVNGARSIGRGGV